MESSTQKQSVNEKEKKHQGLDITLRRLDASDVDDYMVWASDDKVSRFCTWETYTSKDDLLTYINQVVLPHPWFMAICLDGRPVGAISVTPSVDPIERCRGEMGYVLASGHWGRGIATVAVKMAVERVFGEVEGLERVDALVDVGNAASQRVLEKAGFEREGVTRKYMILKGKVRDMVMYSFVSGQ